MNDLLDVLGSAFVVPGRGLQGWSQSVKGFDAEGYTVGAVYFGGGRDDVHVVATSDEAHAARERLMELPEVRTARVDTRVDTQVEFETLAAILEEAAAGYGSRITRMESSERGRSTGRTIYLGAPSSAIRVRLYEKWLESPGQYREGTNRVEVQLRPPSKVKGVVSSWTAAETFCASRVTTAIAEALTGRWWPAGTLQVKKRTPDLERTIEAMGQQYRGSVERWLDWSGGDVGRVLEHLGAQ